MVAGRPFKEVLVAIMQDHLLLALFYSALIDELRTESDLTPRVDCTAHRIPTYTVCLNKGDSLIQQIFYL